MRKARILASALAVVFAAVQANAQLHYDPYYSIARDIGAKSLNLGLNNSDMAKIGDASDLFAMAKYTFSERFEAGGRVTLGMLRRQTDDVESVVVGIKDIINDYSAASFNILLPVGEVEKPGLSVGYMRTLVSDKLKVNTHGQLGFLEGYTFSPKATTFALAVLIQPCRAFGSKATGYVDVVLNAMVRMKKGTDVVVPRFDTDGRTSDDFGINVRPHVDLQFAPGNILNLGVSIGVAGDNKQDKLGLRVAYKMTLK